MEKEHGIRKLRQRGYDPAKERAQPLHVLGRRADQAAGDENERGKDCSGLR
jgi:hypothetical protein